MLDFGEFRFVQRGTYRHIAAGTDGIDGSILLSSMREWLIRNHATTPTTTTGRPMRGIIAIYWEPNCLLGDKSANFASVVPKSEAEVRRTATTISVFSWSAPASLLGLTKGTSCAPLLKLSLP
jgi:hypothetical protein